MSKRTELSEIELYQRSLVERRGKLDEVCALIHQLDGSQQELPLCRTETGWFTPYGPLSDEGARLFSRIILGGEQITRLIDQLHDALQAQADLIQEATTASREHTEFRQYRPDLMATDGSGHTGADATAYDPHGVGAAWAFALPAAQVCRENLPADPAQRLEAFKAILPTGQPSVPVAVQTGAPQGTACLLDRVDELLADIETP
ncbi:MAG: hypothetical protein PHT19_08880 [Methylococcus sp.]|nr:hypothetical protein [Methylococcus sp.]